MIDFKEAVIIFLKIKNRTATEEEKIKYDVFLKNSSINTKFLKWIIKIRAKKIKLNE